MSPPLKFVTIPDVVLLEVGDWVAGTGKFSPKPGHLASAVEAYNEGAMWAPRGKIGETVHSKKGKAVGRFENLRVGERTRPDGTVVQQLIGDHTCVPAEFASEMPSSYPSRSIEGAHNLVRNGKTYPFAISHVEILGVDGPAVTTLPDITPEQVAAALDVAASSEVFGEVVDLPVAASALTVTDDDVRRAWSDQHPSNPNEPGTESWVMEFGIEPRYVIVDDWGPSPLRASWDVTASGGITFGTPERVQRAGWVLADAATTVSASTSVRVYESRLSARPAHESTEEHMPDPAQLRKALGLDAEATDEQVDAAVSAAAEKGDTPAGDTPLVEETPPAATVEAASGLPEGVVMLTAGQLETLQAQAAAGAQASETLLKQENDRILLSATQERRITAGEQDAMRQRLSVPELRRSTIVLLTAAPDKGGLAPGAVPGAPLGGTGESDVAASAGDDAVYEQWSASFPGGKN
jgi:hypothetical protein